MSSSRLLEGLERIVFSQLYGQTEYFPISVLRKADHDRQRPDLSSSCGVPVASCDVKVLDESDQEVAPGQPGEICVRAAHAVSQYWKRSQDTEALFRNGWLHTRDIARADEKGYLYILDCKKDMIVSGRFNIYPRDVEDALSTLRHEAACADCGRQCSVSKRVLAVDGAYLRDNPCRHGKAACFHYLNINELFTISNERMRFST